MNKNVQSTNCDKLGGETRWQVIGNGKNLLLHWYHQPCTVWTVPTSFFLLNCDEYLHRTHSCITRRYIWYIQDTRYFIFQIMAPGGHDTTFIISTYIKRKNDVGTVHTVHGWWYQWSRRFLPFPITCHLVSPPSLSQFVLYTFLFILVSYNFMSFPSSFSSNSDRFFTWKKNLNLRFLCSNT
jgi:hypothetical protein